MGKYNLRREGYAELACAVIEQALDDYKHAVKKQRKNSRFNVWQPYDDYNLDECEFFFNSEWAEMLSLNFSTGVLQKIVKQIKERYSIMIKVENVKVYNLKGAIKAMRLPYKSGEGTKDLKADKPKGSSQNTISDKDKELACKLINAGTSHRKFLRQIMVSMDITAPLYWWKQFDTYKVGTTSNSESTMHTLIKQPIDIDDFIGLKVDELDDTDLSFNICSAFDNYVQLLETLRLEYIQTKNPQCFNILVALLPQGYMQKRALTANYEVIRNIIEQRSNHKLREWKDFITLVTEKLPYAQEFLLSGAPISNTTEESEVTQ